MLNVFLIMLIITGTIGGIIYYFKINKTTFIKYDIDEDKYEIDTIVKYIKNTFNDLLKVNLYSMNVSREEFEKKMHNRNQLRNALKTCTYGDVNAKNYVKNFIRDILLKSYGINEDNINKIINFSSIKSLRR